MDLKESKLCVFLLGAGASVELGPPIMRDFMSKARRNYYSRLRSARQKQREGDFLIEDYERLLKFQAEMLHASWAVRRDWENIEELYTQADLRRLSQVPDHDTAESLCTQIAWTIWDIYRQHNGTIPLQAICEQCNREGLRPVFITTNYDLVCESALLFQNQSKSSFT